MMNLTPKQLHILTRIRDLRLARGYSPTMQELADELGISKVTVFEHVEALIKKGALRRRANKARSLELSPSVDLPDEQRNSRMPLVGSIAAGSPIEAVEDRQSLDLEALFAPRGSASGSTSGGGGGGGGASGVASGSASGGHGTGDTFALKVRGDSMIDEHIRDGDYVIIRKQNHARDGQIVVALLRNEEATLKTLYRERGQIRLQPANPNYEPIIVPPDECQIQGIVVGVVRAFNA